MSQRSLLEILRKAMEDIVGMMLAAMTVILGMALLALHLCSKRRAVEAQSPCLPQKRPEPRAVSFGWSQALA